MDSLCLFLLSAQAREVFRAANAWWTGACPCSESIRARQWLCLFSAKFIFSPIPLGWLPMARALSCNLHLLPLIIHIQEEQKGELVGEGQPTVGDW